MPLGLHERNVMPPQEPVVDEVSASPHSQFVAPVTDAVVSVVSGKYSTLSAVSVV